ncbi:PAS domain-containing protein [Pontibacter sp. HSC-36F09]|uniref:PAS domain-containing sensor histidine kinase n=1 Tax=Pontibacter sp. HSC-36F09 TaxID=2910966 RepID=UPI00209FEF73|nr:PAS domain-containing protein [Pontibacter sp. HSC-36F09]MCP2045417.1 PAS domain S-box-containing protein [Pontibacter sp. HSC-36F09]
MTTAHPISPEVLRAFEAVPDLYLVISTDFTILGASKAYLEVTQLKKEDIRGRYLFDAFPVNPESEEPDSAFNLKNSLEWVLQNKKPHQMTVQRYDVQLPPASGEFQETYWLPSNTPVLDEEGNISFILHKVLNVTEQMLVQERLDFSELEVKELHGEQRFTKAALLAARAAAELERSKLYNIFMQAPAMICILDGPQHVFSFANPTYQQLVGNRPILGQPILEAMPELEGQAVITMLDRVYQTGESEFAHEMLVRLDHTNSGTLGNNYYNFTYQTIRDLTGKIDGIMVFAFEVTSQVESRREMEAANQELYLAQEALLNLNQELERRIAARTVELELSKAAIEAQRNQLHTIFMNSPTPFLVVDGPEFRFQLINPAFKKVFPGKRMLGKSLLEVFPELQATPIPEIMEKVYRTGENFEAVEYRLILSRYDGEEPEEIYLTFSFQARRDEKGAIDGVLVFAHDVTEQVKSRQKVEQSAERLRLITDSLPVLIGYLDKEEKYRFTNKAYESWFPLKADDLLGRAVRDVVGEKAYSGVKQYIDRALAGERLDFESRMPYREDFVKYIHTSYVPDIRDGEVAGFYTLVHDVTEPAMARLKLEESELEARALTAKLAAANFELSEINAQLTRTNIDLDNFIYAASHDLKAPIYNIERLLLILIESIPHEVQASQELERVIGMIESSIVRFKRTIDHLTDVTKLQKENNQEASEVDLTELIHNISLDLSAQIETVGADIEVDVTACKAIRFSEKNLRSILYNLLSNALKYRDPERTPIIKISCEIAGDYTLLKVRDNGLGLKPNGVAKIFSMFTRMHDHVEGSGIGLYMVKKIVENAEGWIEVESEIGQGSTFSVYFKR